MSIRNLGALFHPRAVAIIGASEQPSAVGAHVLSNLLASGYGGKIYAVNPKHCVLRGIPCYPDMASIPHIPDLAVICTPAAAVPGLISQLGAKGTKAAVVLSAGLSAAVPGAGTLRDAMLAAARPHLLRILGPNCLGILVPALGLNASFAPAMALRGRLAFVSQSGALATAVLDWSNSRNIGFSHFVTLGDSADVDMGDVLDYLADCIDANAILLYIESVTAARKFMSAARRAARNKPVVVVKAGRVAQGARAAAPHTGAFAGSDIVYDAAIRRAGMLRVDTTDALFDAVETLARARPLRGDRLAIMTNGGGVGVVATDALVRGGGTPATLDPATIDALNAVLPETWSHANPVDIVGDAPVARYVDAMDILLRDRGSDALLFLHAPTAIVPSEDIAAAMQPGIVGSPRNVFACWLGGESVVHARKRFRRAGIPTYDTPEQAVGAFLRVVEYQRNQALLMETPSSDGGVAACDAEQARTIVAGALAAGRAALADSEGRAVLAAYGIPVLPAEMAAVRRPHARELMVGAAVDAVFGPIVLFGQGGTAVEVVADRAVGLVPLNEPLARDLVSRTRVSALLAAYRDQPAIDHAALYRVLIQVSRLMCDIPEIVSLDINPLLADADGVVAVDARVGVARAAGQAADRLAILPYPAALEERMPWGDTTIHVRPARPEDEALYARFFAALTPDDVRRRFFGMTGPLQHRELARMVQLDYDREMAFLAIRKDARGMESIVGEARAVADPDMEAAEFALMVRSDLKSRGLGTLLLARLIRYCADRGMASLSGTVMADNVAMLELARRCGFNREPHGMESEARIRLSLAAAFSGPVRRVAADSLRAS